MWKPAARLEETHLAHPDGTIMKASSGSICSPQTHKSGHPFIRVVVGGALKDIRISRIIAETFHPNPNNYDYVRQIDGDRTNTRADNLAWSGGAYHSTKMPWEKGSYSLRPVSCFHPLLGETKYVSLTEAVRDGHTAEGIRRAIMNRRKGATHHGMTWKDDV